MSDRTEVRPNAEHGKMPLVHWPRAMQQLNSGASFLANLTEGKSDAPDSFSKAPRLKLVLCLVCVLFGLFCVRVADGNGLLSVRVAAALNGVGR